MGRRRLQLDMTRSNRLRLPDISHLILDVWDPLKYHGIERTGDQDCQKADHQCKEAVRRKAKLA
jgi:hypothetical protein